MAWRMQDTEDKERRRTADQGNYGILYLRTYNVPLDKINGGSLPDEGDPMPGSAAALLGPFIEKDGITFGKQRDGAIQEVTLRCRLLRART